MGLKTGPSVSRALPMTAPLDDALESEVGRKALGGVAFAIPGAPLLGKIGCLGPTSREEDPSPSRELTAWLCPFEFCRADKENKSV